MLLRSLVLRPFFALVLRLLTAVTCTLALGACQGAADSHGGGTTPDEPGDPSIDPPEPGDVTVLPQRIDEVLSNPGMGFASFHFGWWCNLPPIEFTPEECAERVLRTWPENYPESGTAYFRWHWSDLEPERGKIAFDLIDAAIHAANLMGMTLAFRVVTIAEGGSGIPDWLFSPPYNVEGEWLPGYDGPTFWPDYRGASFQSEHARLVAALANRYDDHPAVDHIDIGTVGCWGEWNTACLQDAPDMIELYDPADDEERRQVEAAFTQLIDHYLSAFSSTPLVMLGLDNEYVPIMLHATQGGAGWRVDCWGDWGLWGDLWNHQGGLYPEMIAAATAADPDFPDVWKKAPVQLEVCGTMPAWHGLGWTASKPDGKVYDTFQWALEQHASLLNTKSTPVPDSYVDAVDELLKQNGYRFVIDRFTHQSTVRAGSSTDFVTDWSNLGVAPAYLRRTLTYRLRGASKTVSFASKEDIRTWLPGSWTVRDTINVPENLPKGSYQIDLALLDRDGSAPDTKALSPLQLGIDGRDADGWYNVSELTVE